MNRNYEGAPGRTGRSDAKGIAWPRPSSCAQISGSPSVRTSAKAIGSLGHFQDGLKIIRRELHDHKRERRTRGNIRFSPRLL